MIGLFLGEKDLPNEIIKKIEKKKIQYFIIDLTKNNKFKINKNVYRNSVDLILLFKKH